MFGADSHRYELHSPATSFEVTQFENKYGIQLPGCYRSFLLQVGNGGAGPFYGIYPLGEDSSPMCNATGKLLTNDCIIYPNMSDAHWKALTASIEDENELSDDQLDLEVAKVFGGILTIGMQGCTYYHGIVLNGTYKGRVVNIDISNQKPQFAYEDNFLDWYERWLDEVIAGELIGDGPSWFGYLKGGTDASLIAEFLDTDDRQFQHDCLSGIVNKRKIAPGTLQIIKEQYGTHNNEINTRLLEIWTKFDYETAFPVLVQTAQTDLPTVIRFLRMHAEEKSETWFTLLSDNFSRIEDDETFWYASLLLRKANNDFAHLIIPFTQHADDRIRSTAFSTLGGLPNKADYLDIFVKGLYDKANRVVHATLQALSGINDNSLLPHLNEVAVRYPEEQDYILSNLNRLFEELGVNQKEKPNTTKKKWYQFWK